MNYSAVSCGVSDERDEIYPKGVTPECFYLGSIRTRPIGVGNGLRRPRPPNRACGSPAHGSPVGSFLIGIGSLTHGP